MLTLRPITAVCVALAGTLSAGPLGDQTPPAGGHVHYAEPSAQQASPTGALAPRLQNLGSHTVYWEDLRRNQENGWALFGLLQALRAQNKTADAALVEARFTKAWSRADVTLPASRFGRPVAPGRPR